MECYWLVARELERLRGGLLHQRELVAQILRQGQKLYVRGDIQLQETLNKEVIKNALLSFTDRGILHGEPATDRKGPRYRLDEQWNDEEKLAELVATLETFLKPGQHS